MNTAKEPPKVVHLNIEVSPDVHRRAKAAAALAQMNWNQAVSEALSQWAQSKGVKR
jgi:predicted HicB family RNase H-like nuclease